MQLDSNKKSKSFFKSNCISAKTDSALSEVNESVSKSDKSRGFFKTAEKEETGGNAILGLLMYSLILLFVPLFIYFGAKQALEDNGYEPPTSTIAPAIMAIGSVNIVIVLYVIKAFKEEGRTMSLSELKED